MGCARAFSPIQTSRQAWKSTCKRQEQQLLCWAPEGTLIAAAAATTTISTSHPALTSSQLKPVRDCSTAQLTHATFLCSCIIWAEQPSVTLILSYQWLAPGQRLRAELCRHHPQTAVRALLNLSCLMCCCLSVSPAEVIPTQMARSTSAPAVQAGHLSCASTQSWTGVMQTSGAS